MAKNLKDMKSTTAAITIDNLGNTPEELARIAVGMFHEKDDEKKEIERVAQQVGGKMLAHFERMAAMGGDKGFDEKVAKAIYDTTLARLAKSNDPETYNRFKSPQNQSRIKAFLRVGKKRFAQAKDDAVWVKKQNIEGYNTRVEDVCHSIVSAMLKDKYTDKEAFATAKKTEIANRGNGPAPKPLSPAEKLAEAQRLVKKLAKQLEDLGIENVEVLERAAKKLEVAEPKAETKKEEPKVEPKAETKKEEPKAAATPETKKKRGGNGNGGTGGNGKPTTPAASVPSENPLKNLNLSPETLASLKALIGAL
jgi:hypothetical protein